MVKIEVYRNQELDKGIYKKEKPFLKILVGWVEIYRLSSYVTAVIFSASMVADDLEGDKDHSFNCSGSKNVSKYTIS
jgi:hypothetical protein